MKTIFVIIAVIICATGVAQSAPQKNGTKTSTTVKPRPAVKKIKPKASTSCTLYCAVETKKCNKECKRWMDPGWVDSSRFEHCLDKCKEEQTSCADYCVQEAEDVAAMEKERAEDKKHAHPLEHVYCNTNDTAALMKCRAALFEADKENKQ